MSVGKKQYLTVKIWHIFLNKSLSYGTAYFYKKKQVRV